MIESREIANKQKNDKNESEVEVGEIAGDVNEYVDNGDTFDHDRCCK